MNLQRIVGNEAVTVNKKQLQSVVTEKKLFD